ncbi:DUF3180 domain-containing protein [Corynebacterium jeikeium]|uniref:DUF3180 domain-containing protein n=1 Tax=Corynebacterium macclintockiae TaxID=2913501 RepID=UPI0005520790
MSPLKRTKISAIAAVAVVCALIGWVSVLSFYGSMPPIKTTGSVLLWLFAIVCAVAGWVIRKRIGDNGVGMDRSQIQPTTIAQWLALGQATAWAGAVFLGLFAGAGLYIVPNAGRLMAAEADLPGVISGVLGSLAAVVAGIWLERSCEAPPPDAPFTANGLDVG